ncbi:Copper chaperone for superoxide dismutase [Papilio machaon]|uniref:Extracellular superoxide dismutase [Cu-Zn] n=1 Tax=Papilio machaon TaxID=76193 RepID=A0A0N1IG53_PAPMA|nr:Copper chaperone for superoxide dismutase [Papilio machaon]
MKHYLVYEKKGHYVPETDDIEQNTEVIDQGATTVRPQTTEVLLEVPINETTITNEREKKTSLTHVKKYRPFSIEYYNEILHQNIPKSSTKQTETQEKINRFKLPVSNEYDPENLNWNQSIDQKIRQINSNKDINEEEFIKTENKVYTESFIHDKNKEDYVKEDVKETARKIITESLVKAIPIREEIGKDINKELNIENDIRIIKTPSVMMKELKQENELNENLLDKTSEINKSVKESVDLYESIDTKLGINNYIKPDDERKLFLLQEIEESIEEGLVKKKSTIFENKTKQITIRGRQMEKFAARKVFSIASETIKNIKRTAESRLSKPLLKIFLLYLINIMITLTRCMSIYSKVYNSSRKEELESTTKLTKEHQESFKRKLSSADIVQLVSGKPKDLTERMDTVISEFHTKLNINKSQVKLQDNRRAKSVSKVDKINDNKTFEWISELDREEREQIKEEIKLATLAAARRVLGRRRSYHNLTDIENEKIDGLTYIAIVESHVYTNRNAIFNDYISRLKKQVNDVLEITDINETFATDCTVGKSYKYSSNQSELKDAYAKNTEDSLSKDVSIDERQKIEYVATVTVEHKQIPNTLSTEEDEKYIEINKLALNETILTSDLEDREVKQITTKTEDRIEVNETKNSKEAIIPKPIMKKVEFTTNINEATVNQMNELLNKEQKESVEITELKENLSKVNKESKELNNVQARGVETIEEITTARHETEENQISYAISNASAAVVEENKFIAQENTPIVEEVRNEIIKVEVAKEATADSHFTEAGTVTVTDIKEQIPKITEEQEKLSKAQMLNKEYIRQENEVYFEVDVKDGEPYKLLEDKGLLTTETGKIIATKMINETYINEEPIEMPQTEVQSEVSAKITTEESHLESALATSRGMLCEFTTETETAVSTEDVKIEKEVAMTKAETNELANAQIVAIATARQTSEVFDEVQNDVEITEITEELPTTNLVEENLRKPVIFGKDVLRQISAVFNTIEEDIEKEHLQEEKAVEVIEVNELATAHKLNYAHIEEKHAISDHLNIQSSYCEDKNTFENECMTEEHALYEEEKRDYYLSQPVCTSVCYYIEINLEECKILEKDKILEQLPKISIEENVFGSALSICNSTLNEFHTTYIEAELIDKEDLTLEKAESSEEENKYFKTLVTCIEICENIEVLLEDTYELIVDKFQEEFATTQIEPEVFVTALTICISISNEINTIYVEAEFLPDERLPEEKSELSEEKNNYFNALAVCNEVSQDIELLLEESNELIIEQLKDEFPSTSTETFVLERTLPLSTSILSQIDQELYEAMNLEIEDLRKEEVKVLIEISKLTLILAICIAAMEEIYKDLEECTPFTVEEINDEIGNFIEEPFVLIRILPTCVSILEHINISHNNAEVLEIQQLPIENANSTLEVNHFVTILAICTGIVETKITTLDEVNSFKIDEILEYKASEYLEPKTFSKTLPKCIATVFILNVPVFEVTVREPECFEHTTASESLKMQDLVTAQITCQSILEQDEISVNEVEKTSSSYEVEENYANLSYEDIEVNATYNVSTAIEKQIEPVDVKIEPTHNKNVASIQEVNVNKDNTTEIVKSRKKKNINAVSLIKDKVDTKNIKVTAFEENSADFESFHIEELKEDDLINDQITIIEEPVHLMAKETVTIGRKKANVKQKASNAVYQESNIQSNENVDACSTSVNIQPTKKCINNEANVNISIQKAKAKKNENYQEMSYNLTLTKPQVMNIPVSETKEETLYVKRREDLKQHYTEEFEEEFNLNLNEDVESGVVIHEITASDEDIEDSINIDNRNESMDASLEFKSQSETQDESKDVYETSTLVKRRSKEYDSRQKSAALTIFRKEVFEEDIPVIEKYDENNININVISTYSNNKSECVGKTETISQSSDFESKSVPENTVNNKRVSKRISKSNTLALNVGFKEDKRQEVGGRRHTDLEINASRSQINTIEGSFEKSVKTSSISQESTTLVSQEYHSTIVNNKSKSLSLKTNLKQEETEGSQIEETSESSPEIKSPTEPPTPLTDEYIFRLVAPLPKSRGTTPVPREPSPEIIDKDQSILNKNLVPNIDSVAIERVVYNPPLPTPLTSPVHSPTYTKPGLNGGMKRLPRYFKPGLRGGSDRPPISKEEILEVRKNLSTLTTDINETLKNIEKYKKLVEILKQKKAEEESSTMMEEDDTTNKQTKPEEVEDAKDAKENETSEQITTEKPINEKPPESNVQTNSQTDEFVEIKLNNNKTDTMNIDIKQDFVNRIEEARIKSYNIKEVTSFEEIEKEYENIGIVELAPDTAGEESIEKEFNIITEDSESEKPKVLIKIERDKEKEKSEDKDDVTSDEEQKAIDEEVARLNTDLNTSKEISPIESSPSEADTIKEAHIISLTRVLSSHMLREGLSPDCQKMKDKFENEKNIPEEKIKDEDRSWTTFLQKSTNLPTQKLGHFADLQNKFEKQEDIVMLHISEKKFNDVCEFNPHLAVVDNGLVTPKLIGSEPFVEEELFTTKVTDRNEVRLSPVIKPKDFNSSPVPWQERALADTLGASNIKVEELTPGDEPQFFLAIPTESKDDGVLKSTVIPLPNPKQEIPNVDINEKLIEDRKSEHTVDQLIQEALIKVDNLNIGAGKNRLIQLLLNNIKNITDSDIPVEDQLNQMRKQLDTLEQVPDIIKETLENVAGKLHLINQKEVIEPKVITAVEANKEEPQIIKEKAKETKVAKMSAETKGELLVKDKKLFEPQMTHKNRPQQKFGWMKPEPRPIKLFGGRRWKRPGEEYTEEQIAETILAHSELIQGKTMGINFMKYEKPPIPLDHLQHSEVFKMIHNTEETPQKPVELLRTVIAEADYRELEVLVDFGPKLDQNVLDKTLNMLKSQDGVQEAVYKDGAIMVETILPSTQILDIVTQNSGKRAVLQGFGDTQSAVSMVSSQSCCGTNVLGVVRFQQTREGSLIADGCIDGLTPGCHGLHVHEVGDLSQGCKSIGEHYNPLSATHGAPNDPEHKRHAGDLGNIVADETGRATFRIVDNVLKVWDIIGRSVAVTERGDDFGRGTSPESRIDGDSGSPVACGIIARSAGVFQNPKRICACDGVIVWDEKDRPLAGKGRREETKEQRCCKKETQNDAVKPCCKV